MRKSNWIFYIIAIVISAFLLWLWFWLGFDHVDAPLDLVLSIIWWILVVVACIIIHRVEKKRQERVRTCYVNKWQLYNSEAGTIALEGFTAENIVESLHDVLKDLKYGFDIEDRPEDDEGNPREFDFVVRSKVFDLKREDEDEEAEKSEADEEDEEELEWEGEVALPSRPDDDPLPFESREELTDLMTRLIPLASA